MTRSNRCLTAVAVLSLLAASQTPANAQFVRDPEAIAAYEAGNELLEQEKWDEAIDQFTNATTLDPTFAEAFLGKGEALRELEDYQSAMTSYRSAIDIDPKLAKAFNGRGVCSRELGDINLALSDFSNATELDRNDADSAANYGDLLINYVGDAARAIDQLDKAIELDPENSEAFRNRGWAHTNLREFDEAIADLEKSIEIDSSDHETYTKLAAVYLFQEDYQPGIDALSKAIENYEPEESSDPDTYINGYLQRADAELNLGNQATTTPEQREQLYEAAIADADAVLAEYPDRFPEAGFAMYRRGLALRMQNRFGEAIKSITDAIQLVPAGEDGSYVAQAYLKRGICWHYQGQDSLARGDFEESASLSFEDPLPHLWIGFTYAQDGDYRDAIENYGKAIAQSPSFALAYVNRGLAYMQLEEYNKAVDNFNEAIRSEPNEAEHFVKRGLAHMQLEEYQKAFDSFEHALLRDDQNLTACREAAKALRELGRPSLAEQYEAKAATLEPAQL